MFVVFQAKSGKELVGFLMNDFLLLTQPPKPLGNSFSFEKYANATFKLYKKVRLKFKTEDIKFSPKQVNSDSLSLPSHLKYLNNFRLA
jgi:hypothetical protein